MDYLTRYLGSTTTLPTKSWGVLAVEVASFTPAIDGDLVVRFGNPDNIENPLVRVHSECVFAEALDSALCDCSDQLRMALHNLQSDGNGWLFYLRFDGRGAGLAAKVKATELEVAGVGTYESRKIIGVEPEGREFAAIGRYLFERGVKAIRLLTNNPKKVRDIESAGVIVERIPLFVPNPSPDVDALYEEKRRKFGHMIPK